MYRLTLQECREFRKMEYGELYNLYERCNHRFFQTYNDTVFVCKRCKLSWNMNGPHPPRGNVGLEYFLRGCTHRNVRTFAGTTTKNQCIECDRILEKTEIAKIWKAVSRAFKNDDDIDIKVNSGRRLRYIWDPDIYGEHRWGVEYDD